MKKIGIVGGIAWPSTVEYYAGLCRLAEHRHLAQGGTGVAPMPRIAIESLDLRDVLAAIGDDDDEASWIDFDALHRDALLRLQAGGADIAVIASNTPHHRFASITRAVRMPVPSILDAAARACREHDARHVLILGTQTTMRSQAFHTAFASHGIEAFAPADLADRRRIAGIIEALQRECIEGATARIEDIVAKSLSQAGNHRVAVYLGCTELPLAFPEFHAQPQFECHGLRYLNSTALHIQAAFEYALGQTR